MYMHNVLLVSNLLIHVVCYKNGRLHVIQGWNASMDMCISSVHCVYIKLYSYASQQFYRHALVFPPFAASALGLFTLSVYLLLRRFQKEDIRITDQEVSQTMSVRFLIMYRTSVDITVVGKEFQLH